MTILWAGTSIADFSIQGVNTSFSAGKLPATRAANVDEAVNSIGGSKFTTPEFTPVSELWVSGFVYWYSVPSFNTQSLYELVSPTGDNLFRLAFNGSSAMLLQFWRSGAWVTVFTEPSTTTTTEVLYRYDIQVKLHATDGYVKVYRDGALFINYTGNTSSSAGVVTNRFRACSTYASGGPTASSFTNHSAMIIADDDTRPLTFIQRIPNGNGDHTDWTGGYADVDETGINDADLITTGTTGAMESFTFPALPGSEDTRQLETLILAARTRGDGAPEVLQALARVGSTDYTASPRYERSAIYQPQQWQFPVNPATGARWTGSQVNGAQFGVKAAS